MTKRILPLASLVVALSGCLPSSEVIPVKFYSLAPTAVPQPPAPSNPAIPGTRIGIAPFESVDRIGSSLMVRLPAFQVAHLEFDRWADTPANTLTQRLAMELQQSGRFEEVTDAKNVSLPGYYLSGKLLAFEGVQSDDSGIALCRFNLELRGTKDRSLVWSQMFESTADWDPAGAAKTLVPALDQATQQAVTQAVESLAEALATRAEQ